jgi:hypothetical protein
MSISKAKEWLQSVIRNHLGANIRRYKFKIWVAGVNHNSLGGVITLAPLEGKVAEVGDEYTLIKQGPSEVCVVRTDLLDTNVSVGDKIACKFFELRRFDGKLSNGSQDDDGSGCISFMLTGAKTYLPVMWDGRYTSYKAFVTDGWSRIENPYLRDLVTQIESIPAPDGFRTGADILVNANAKNLRFVDPAEDQSANEDARKWPSILCDVATAKFTGELALRYDRGADTFQFDLTDLQGNQTVREEIHFNEVVSTLLEFIDDGSWNKVQVTLLKKAPKARAASAQAELIAA